MCRISNTCRKQEKRCRNQTASFLPFVSRIRGVGHEIHPFEIHIRAVSIASRMCLANPLSFALSNSVAAICIHVQISKLAPRCCDTYNCAWETEARSFLLFSCFVDDRKGLMFVPSSKAVSHSAKHCHRWETQKKVTTRGGRSGIPDSVILLFRFAFSRGKTKEATTLL